MSPSLSSFLVFSTVQLAGGGGGKTIPSTAKRLVFLYLLLVVYNNNLAVWEAGKELLSRVGTVYRSPIYKYLEKITDEEPNEDVVIKNCEEASCRIGL